MAARYGNPRQRYPRNFKIPALRIKALARVGDVTTKPKHVLLSRTGRGLVAASWGLNGHGALALG
jgi:hypothetical protein